jgi:succinyl-CoA synthetase beta subunit
VQGDQPDRAARGSHEGTNEELGKKLLADSGLPIISADSMAEAAQKVMEALK